jgi:NhaP-type Na+/H+ or K+/H+ antiporter
MSELEFVALVLAAIGPLLALAKLTGLPQIFLLAGAGLGSAFLPGLPPVRADPQLLLSLFLPPLLYAGTVQVSVHLLRFAALSGVLVGALVSVCTIVAVAAAARWLLLPGLGWAPALLLGVVAAVFDTRLFQEAKGQPHVPRVVADALKAREMVARVVALSALSLVVGSLETGAPHPLLAAGRLLWAIGGGAVLVAAVGRTIVWLRERVEPAPVEIAVSIATPYLCSLGALWLGLSVVVVIMAAALTVAAVRVDRETGAPRTSSEARISAVAFWEEASLLVSSAMFFLAGRALPEAMAELNRWAGWRMAGAAAALLFVVLAVQFAFAYLSTALPPLAAGLRERQRREEGGAAKARAATAALMAWACTRSVIGLVLALSLPPSLEDRGLVLVVAALLILGSVLLQGLTLRPAVLAAALCEDEEEKQEEELATRAANAAAERSGEGENDLDAARRALFELREKDRIGDEALRKMLREADLKTRAAEGPAAALPGAAPPSPR